MYKRLPALSDATGFFADNGIFPIGTLGLILNPEFAMFFKMEEKAVGTRILSTTLFSLLMVGAVDIFLRWYRTFLKKRNVNPRFILLLKRLTFVVLAFLFWRALIAQQTTSEFASTHFFFALFVYCFYRLIASFFSTKAED